MRQGSLRLRLLAAGAVSIVLALGLAGLGLLLLFERHVERRMAAELESHLRQLVSSLARAADGGLEVASAPAEPRFLEPLSGVYWQIGMDRSGFVLRSRSLWDESLQLPPDALGDAEVHQHTIPGPNGASMLAVERLITLPANLGGDRVRVSVAVDRSEIHAAGRAFAADLVPYLAVLAAVLVLAAWVQVEFGLRPLEAVRRKLAQVRAGEVRRLGTAFPDEVRPLVSEVDHLLEMQERAIARARTRAADLAHGLKTPLTILSADAEELRSKGETTLADEIATVTSGMRRHVERELARARVGSGVATSPVQPVRPVIEQVVDVVSRTPQGSRLRWEVLAPDHVCTRIATEDMAEILGNLAENAAYWAPTQVRLVALREGTAVTLVVEDDGPGVPTEQIDTVLARGGRLDEARPGSGLGLAIVGDLVEAYGGSLTLGRSDLGGLSAKIRIPDTI